MRIRKTVRVRVLTAKQKHYASKIESGSSSSKQLFKVTNELLGKQSSKPVPTNVPNSELPQRFSDFFNQKIRILRDELDSCTSEPPLYSDYSGPILNEFVPATQQEIRDLIAKSPAKSCILDPFPTDILKQYHSDHVPLNTNIVNLSITSGVVPKECKRAIVTPLLKKPGFDINNLKNYRPVIQPRLHFELT